MALFQAPSRPNEGPIDANPGVLTLETNCARTNCDSKDHARAEQTAHLNPNLSLRRVCSFYQERVNQAGKGAKKTKCDIRC
jgi:hypothetical protein